MPKKSDKSAEDLRSEPRIILDGQGPELPVNTAIDQLTRTSGDDLELSTRSNPRMFAAASVGYIYTHVFGSKYVQGRVEQMERLAVSTNGQGRRDLIDTVKAGGRMPDSYVQGGGSGSREYRDLWEE